MKYEAKFVGRTEHRDLFVQHDRLYDDRQIAQVAKKMRLLLTRPYGRRPYRGSRRLELTDPRTRSVVWQFTVPEDVNQPTKIQPVPVGFVRF